MHTESAARLEEAVVLSIRWSALRSPADALVEHAIDSISPGTDVPVETLHKIVAMETKSVAFA